MATSPQTGGDLTPDAFNFTLPANQLLLNYINLVNSTEILLEQVTFTDVGPNQQAGINKNTTVTMRSVPGHGYTGLKEFYYNRLNIARAFRPLTVSVTPSIGDTSLYQVLPLINSAFSINLTEDDVYDDLITINPISGASSVNVICKPTSIIYSGETTFRFGQRQAIVGPDNQERYYYTFYNNLTGSDAERSIVRLMTDGTIDTRFQLLSNKTAVSQIQMDGVVAFNTGRIYLSGTVGYQQENPVTGVAETFTVPGVELSAIGEWIRDTDASFLFNTPEFKAGFKYTDSHSERVYYQTVTGNQYTLRRADSNGAVDITFNTALPPEYEIDKVAVRRQGAMAYVFVITKPFLDGNKNSVKVFKLKNDGSLDTSFQTITLKPITGTNLPPVSSIAVDTLQQVYVSFGAHYGLSFSMLDLQVNNINTRTLHPLGAGSSVGSYLPVIKFKPDGQFDQDFKFIHPDINDLAFFGNDIPGIDKNVPIVGVNNAAEGGLVYILLNRRDQVTGYQRPELVGLNQNGQISYSSTVYGDKNKPYWKTIKASKLLNNDCALLVGELYTKNSSNNTWSASPSESLVVYDPVGSALIARDTIVQYTGKPLFALNVVEVYEP